MATPIHRAYRGAYSSGVVMPHRCPKVAALVFADMVKHGPAPADPIANLANLLCTGSGRASNVASRLAPRVVAGDPRRLAQLVHDVQSRRGWGRSFKHAVSRCLRRIPLDTLMDQPDTDFGFGITLRYLVRRAHPEATDPNRGRVYRDLMRGM